MQLTSDEASQALREIERSRLVFRRAIGAARGYQHLWLWGVAWIAFALDLRYGGERAGKIALAIEMVGFLGSAAIGWAAHRKVKAPSDRRFLAAIATVVLFAIFVWPVLLGPPSGNAYFAYPALVAMQLYILGGLWFDNYLLWVGLLVSVVIMAGYVFFASFFWWWAAFFGGGTLILSGFYIRSRWR